MALCEYAGRLYQLYDRPADRDRVLSADCESAAASHALLSIHTVLFFSICACSEPATDNSADEGEFYVDQSKWVDPGDMAKFDFSSASMTAESGTQTTEQCSCPANQLFDAPDVDCMKTKEKLAACKKDLSVLSKILNKSDGNPKTDAFFRRLAIILTNKLAEMNAAISSPDHLSIQFNINQKFVDRVGHLQRKHVNETTPVASIVDEVSDILIPLIQKSYLREQESFWVRHFDHFVVGGASVSLFILVYLLLQRKIFVVMTMSFVISVLWEWRRLYEEEIIRKEVTLMSGPAECGQSWGTFLMNGLSSLFVMQADSSDPCHKYYSSVGVKTILKCNPMLAVQNVVGMLFGGSFALLASYFGKATKNYFSHIPLLWSPFVGSAVLVLLIFAMTFSFGYDVRVPFLSLQRNRRTARLHWNPPLNEDARRPAVNAAHAAPIGDVPANVRMAAATVSLREGGRSRDVHKSPAARRTQSLNQSFRRSR